MARWGGEEFLVWLADTPAVEAARVAEKLRLAVATAPLLLPSGETVAVTLSAGVAKRSAGEALDPCIARADEALYAAKRAGRNRVVLA